MPVGNDTHAACEVAGAGNGATDVPKRARRGKPRIRPRDILRATAPAPDPTNFRRFRGYGDLPHLVRALEAIELEHGVTVEKRVA